MQKTSLLFATLPFLAQGTLAETPAFDRPGIGFSTTTLPPATVAWEQGMPDMTRTDDGGLTQTQYSADTLLRIGLAEKLELDLSLAPHNYQRSEGLIATTDEEGAGDTGLALKYALPDIGENLSWAILGGATFATGNEPFTNGHTLYSLGVSLERSLGDDRSLAFYGNIDSAAGDTALTFSPSYSFALNDCLDAYFELGYTHAEDDGEDIVAGGGITWMVAETVQLDLYADFGLTADSTDLAGFGFSVFFD